MLSLSQSVTAFSARPARAISVHQLRLLDLVEVDDLRRRRPARHQQQPRIVGVVDHQHARQRQVADVDGVARKLRMQRPGWRRRRRDDHGEEFRQFAASGGKLARRAGGACIPVPFRRYRGREVGGGRATRQPGQVRKEAALTSSGSGRSSASHLDSHASAVIARAPTREPDPASHRDRRRTDRGSCMRGSGMRPTTMNDATHAASRRLPRAGAQIPPGDLRRPDRPGRHGAHDLERVRDRPHPAGLDPHRRARRRQDHDRAHPGPRAQLRAAGRLGRPARPSRCRCSACIARRSWRAGIST